MKERCTETFTKLFQFAEFIYCFKRLYLVFSTKGFDRLLLLNWILIQELIITIAIYSIVIGLKNSCFSPFQLPSCYRTVLLLDSLFSDSLIIISQSHSKLYFKSTYQSHSKLQLRVEPCVHARLLLCFCRLITRKKTSCRPMQFGL